MGTTTITLKQPPIWRLLPSGVDPQLLYEHQEQIDERREPHQEPPRPVVKRVCQCVIADDRKGLLTLHLEVVQKHPGEILNHLVPVWHDGGLSYANFTLLGENLQGDNGTSMIQFG